MVESRTDWRRTTNRGSLPLRDPESGVEAAVELLTAALTRNVPVEGLAMAFGMLLQGRGQLTFLRGDPVRPDLYVHDGSAAPIAVSEVSGPAPAAELGKLLASRTVIALSLREGMDAPQVEALVTKLMAAGQVGRLRELEGSHPDPAVRRALTLLRERLPEPAEVRG